MMVLEEKRQHPRQQQQGKQPIYGLAKSESLPAHDLQAASV
jgi:hypothetical protein